MKTSRFLTVAAMALIVSTSVFAQDDQSANRRPRPQGPQVAQQDGQAQAPERKQPTEEEMLQQRTERMQRELLLDEATAQKFAPIYQEYLTALKELRGDAPRGPQEVKAGEQPEKKELTDAELTAKLKERIQKQRDMADLQEKYIDKLGKVLNARQLAKVFEAPRPGHGPGQPGQGPHHGQPGKGGQPGHGQGQPGQPGQPGQGGQPGQPGQGGPGAPQGGQPQAQPQAQQQ